MSLKQLTLDLDTAGISFRSPFVEHIPNIHGKVHQQLPNTQRIAVSTPYGYVAIRSYLREENVPEAIPDQLQLDTAPLHRYGVTLSHDGERYRLEVHPHTPKGTASGITEEVRLSFIVRSGQNVPKELYDTLEAIANKRGYRFTMDVDI